MSNGDNYQRVLTILGRQINPLEINIPVDNTKTNLLDAARKELEKIDSLYPHFLKELEAESFEEAIISCMYSWKLHRQHEEKVRSMAKYSGWFLSTVARRLEGLEFYFYVCSVCGSTIDEAPAISVTVPLHATAEWTCPRSLDHRDSR